MSDPSPLPLKLAENNNRGILRSFDSVRTDLFLTKQQVVSLDKPTDCAICIDESEDASQCFVLLSCGHCFHSHCAIMFFIRQPHNTCPMCRAECEIVPREATGIDWSKFESPHQRSSLSLPCACCRGETVPEKAPNDWVRPALQAYIGVPQPWLLLNCGHEFHSGCIRQWFNLRVVCPLCNKMPDFVPR